MKKNRDGKEIQEPRKKRVAGQKTDMQSTHFNKKMYFNFYFRWIKVHVQLQWVKSRNSGFNA